MMLVRVNVIAMEPLVVRARSFGVRRRSLLILGGSAAAIGSSVWLERATVARAKPPAAGERGVIVELFTSQGCSSCPPADAQLRRLAKRVEKSGEAIYPLSFHVDHWNDLGWRDPYSRASYSERQRLYAHKRGSTRVYTPQMIVDGRDEFVGSSGRALKIYHISQGAFEKLSAVIKLGDER